MTSSARSSYPPHAVSGIVIVFYFPDTACYARVNHFAAAGLRVVVVDNTPSPALETPADLKETAVDRTLDGAVHVIANNQNLGIARALNQGVEHLIAIGCNWALLFDQDSNPSMALLAALPDIAAQLAERDPRIALIGPAYEDPKLGGRFPFVRFRAFIARRIASEGLDPVDTDLLITSGSCINLKTWSSIGPMDESLFIDSVDLEWCIRAKFKGYRILGIPWITLRHELGGKPVSVFGILYPTHSPIRHYYMFRNAVSLCLRSYVPWRWKSLELAKMPLRFLVHGIYFKPRAQHLAMALKGICDGLRGRMGPADGNR